MADPLREEYEAFIERALALIPESAVLREMQDDNLLKIACAKLLETLLGMDFGAAISSPNLGRFILAFAAAILARQREVASFGTGTVN